MIILIITENNIRKLSLGLDYRKHRCKGMIEACKKMENITKTKTGEAKLKQENVSQVFSDNNQYHKKITDSIECYDKSIDLRELVRKLSPKSFVIEGDNFYFVISI